MNVKKMKKEELHNVLLRKEEEIRLANETNAKLIEDNDKLSATIVENKNMLSQLRAKTTELSKEIVGKEDIIAKLKKEVVECNKKLTIATNKSKSYLDIITELRSKIDNLNGSISFLSTRKADLEKDCYEYEEELNNYKNSVVGYTQEIDMLKAQNTRLNDELIAMSEDNERCHNEVTQAFESKLKCIEYYKDMVKKLKKRIITNSIITIVGMTIMLIIVLLS